MSTSVSTAVEAQPLRRMGSYKINERPGSNAAPAEGVAGDALAAWWQRLLGALTAKWKQRDELASWLSDPRRAGDGIRYRYTGKIELKSAEAVAALFHQILAPHAPFLCDEHCPHFQAGATPEHAKRFLDSLDAVIAERRADWKSTPPSHPCYEDLQDEAFVYETWRREFARLFTD
jgi:hypothetical protein